MALTPDTLEWRRERWDRRFLEMARLISGWSKDPSTQVGAVVVGPNQEIRATGYNGIPRGVHDDTERMFVRPEKYLWMEHGERNAIYDAARRGVSLEGCTIYVTPLAPCADCARAIIQSGIIRVVIEADFREPGDSERLKRWKTHYDVTFQMFREADVVWTNFEL